MQGEAPNWSIAIRMIWHQGPTASSKRRISMILQARICSRCPSEMKRRWHRSKCCLTTWFLNASSTRLWPPWNMRPSPNSPTRPPSFSELRVSKKKALSAHQTLMACPLWSKRQKKLRLKESCQNLRLWKIVWLVRKQRQSRPVII